MTSRPALRRPLFHAALASPGLIPILAPLLPFQDWPAHLGVIGALIHLDDPEARIRELYDFIGWIRPNAGFYAIVYPLAKVLPPLIAANLVFALALGALGPAVARLCRATGADERLAFFALPLAIGRHVYCGFAPNAAALPFLILAVAVYFELRERPRISKAVLLAVLLLAAQWLHFFVYLAGAGLLLLAIALDLRSRAGFMGLLATAASFGAFIAQLRASAGRTAIGSGAFNAVLDAVRSADRTGIKREFWEWLFASYRYAIADDVFQAIWLAAFLTALVTAVARERRAFFSTPRARLLLMAAAALSMFAILPSNIGPPLNWWGGNLRLPVIALLLAAPIGGVAPKRLCQAAGALALSIVFVASADLIRFSRREMSGFLEVVETLPPGKKVTLLHYTPHEVHEYPGEPHGYASNYYLLLKGGFVPQNVFENPDVPFARKVSAPAPPWGMAEGFDWWRHGVGYDYFVLRNHPSVDHAPLHGENQSRVELVKAAGNWRQYRAR